MIQAYLAIAANRVIIDATSNQLSIIDVFEGMKSQAFPVIIPRLTFLFYLQRSAENIAPKELTFRGYVDDVETMRFPVQIEFQNSLTTRSIIGFDGFVIPRPGNMRIELFDGDISIGGLKLPIEKLEIAPTQTHASTPPGA